MFSPTTDEIRYWSVDQTALGLNRKTKNRLQRSLTSKPAVHAKADPRFTYNKRNASIYCKLGIGELIKNSGSGKDIYFYDNAYPLKK